MLACVASSPKWWPLLAVLLPRQRVRTADALRKTSGWGALAHRHAPNWSIVSRSASTEPPHQIGAPRGDQQIPRK